MKKIGIVGAGIVGRLLAWHLCQQPYEIHLFCQGSIDSEDACSFMAAGMISPFSEQEFLTKEWHLLSQRALTFWPMLLSQLQAPVFYRDNGALVLVSPRQKAHLIHYIHKIQHQLHIKVPLLTENEVSSLEPELTGFVGCYLPNEARIDPQQLFCALNTFLLHQGVVWHPFHNVQMMKATHLQANDEIFVFEKIIDCRGVGAKEALSTLRGVRGELIYCQATQVNIQRQIRLLHPRYPCYIVPRSDSFYVIGATQIESENKAPMTVESALNLLASAVNVHTGFYEAHITALHAGCRPTMKNHFPCVLEKEGVMHINGMFRHGFLLAPALVEQAARRIVESIYPSPLKIRD